ncbi:GyrI-like domain-containing protein [Brevibacterium spongiae]|uniref:GyrI-like domain-containing protein n=1 Tax=Brevibacterium spongiae TaxID=2909672 RepID=A0ABY5SQD4_9MICO|nr:GyrI-like domain-containing protein [Brevibacterium spongiae]UVI36131.1 GyrI-like domain-containing protein [Brevibacterium spongiae]
MSEPSYLREEPYTELTVVEVPGTPAAVVEARDVPMAELPALFDATFSGLFPVLSEAGVEPAGPAFALYTRQPSETVDLQVGIPISAGLTNAQPISGGHIVIPSELPAGSMAVSSHLGGYDGLGETWAQLLKDAVAAGHHPGLPFIELYVTEPSPEADPADMRTDLFITLE